MVTNTVAQSSQVCYTLLARGVSSRNRLLCALVRSNCGIEVQSITIYTASLLCAPCFALKQTDLQNLIVLCPVGRAVYEAETKNTHRNGEAGQNYRLQQDITP